MIALQGILGWHPQQITTAQFTILSDYTFTANFHTFIIPPILLCTPICVSIPNNTRTPYKLRLFTTWDYQGIIDTNHHLNNTQQDFPYTEVPNNSACPTVGPDHGNSEINNSDYYKCHKKLGKQTSITFLDDKRAIPKFYHFPPNNATGTGASQKCSEPCGETK